MAATNGEFRMLFSGAGRVIITPPLGIRMAGYTVQECLAESVERELTATAVVLDDGVCKVVLIGCDLLFIQSPHVDRIRQRIGAGLGIPAEHVLINTSHTHLGPTLPGWHITECPEQTRMQQRYLDVLEESLVGVSALADRQKQPARIGAGKGKTSIGVNRRERLSDGRVVIGENPDGAVDDDVHVIRIDDLDGKPIALVMAAAAHPIVLGPRTSSLSPDYVGPAREIVESATGAPTLFLQGAAGNVCPRCGIGSGGPDQHDDLQRIGAELGGQALDVWSRIRTHSQRGPRRIVQSVAALSAWDYEPTVEACIEHMSVQSSSIALATAPLPERHFAEENRSRYLAMLERAEQTSKSVGEIQVAQRLLDWSELVLRTIDAGDEPIKRELHVWGLRINDIGIVAVNGEPFAELGLEVKSRSPLSKTMFLGYSNGCLGYLPTPEAFDEGGMEVHESVQNYLLPTAFTPEWGPAVVNQSLEVLNRL